MYECMYECMYVMVLLQRPDLVEGMYECMYECMYVMVLLQRPDRVGSRDSVVGFGCSVFSLSYKD